MPQPIPPTEPRSRDELRRHYEIETALAARLRRASKEERRSLYSEVYDELFRQVPELARKADPAGRAHEVALQAQALKPFLDPETVFLEVGAGDCALSLHLAGKVRQVYAVEAAAEVSGGLGKPEGFELLLTDTNPLPLDAASVDVAYSCHFLEHLHPEDAAEHAAEMRRVLRPGGVYVAITPNRLWGPHDVSRYFDDVPTGFHLREYTHVELARLLRRAGFARVEVLRGVGERPRLVSLRPYLFVEGTLSLLPAMLRRRAMALLFGRRGAPPFRPLEQVKVVARR